MKQKPFLLAISVVMLTASTQQALVTEVFAEEKVRLAELNAYWAEVSRCVKVGDFKGYSATAHSDAVFIWQPGKKAQLFSDVLKKWKKEFDDTKAGKMTASVEFRFSQRLGDANSAHETGILLYESLSKEKDAKPKKAYVNFQALLVKRDGKWLMTMEYQIGRTDQAAFDKLKPAKSE